MLANGNENTEPVSKKKRWLALGLLIFMIVGATVGELPAVKEAIPGCRIVRYQFGKNICYDKNNGKQSIRPEIVSHTNDIAGYQGCKTGIFHRLINIKGNKK